MGHHRRGAPVVGERRLQHPADAYRNQVGQPRLVLFRDDAHRISTGKQTRYAQSEKERDQIVKEMDRKNVSVQRFKGLGEMNAEQLWETTMNPETRTLLRAEIEDAAEADAIFTMLMGEKVAPRKDFIKAEARKVRNLDV